MKQSKSDSQCHSRECKGLMIHDPNPVSLYFWYLRMAKMILSSIPHENGWKTPKKKHRISNFAGPQVLKMLSPPFCTQGWPCWQVVITWAALWVRTLAPCCCSFGMWNLEDGSSRKLPGHLLHLVETLPGQEGDSAKFENLWLVVARPCARKMGGWAETGRCYSQYLQYIQHWVAMISFLWENSGQPWDLWKWYVQTIPWASSTPE